MRLSAHGNADSAKMLMCLLTSFAKQCNINKIRLEPTGQHLNFYGGRLE